jgi:hypothetical protein
LQLFSAVCLALGLCRACWNISMRNIADVEFRKLMLRLPFRAVAPKRRSRHGRRSRQIFLYPLSKDENAKEIKCPRAYNYNSRYQRPRLLRLPLMDWTLQGNSVEPPILVFASTLTLIPEAF